MPCNEAPVVIALVQVRSTVPYGVLAQVFPEPGGQLIGWLLALRIWKFAFGWLGIRHLAGTAC